MPKHLLPEALLDGTSFTSKSSISEAIKKLLGLKGATPPALEIVLDDYARVCQLRHCTVHRFGKLGANSAVHLGLSDHSTLMEKPLKLDYSSLQIVIAVCTVTVRTLNNVLFNELLSRIPSTEWSGNYGSDKLKFAPYYFLFADRKSASPTIPAHKMYRQFLKQRSLHTGSNTTGAI